MISSIFSSTDTLQPVQDQLNDVTLQIEALTNFPEQVFVYESETTISGLVQALHAKRRALLEHKQLMDEFDLHFQVDLDTRAEANA